jgi:hypothetical protein
MGWKYFSFPFAFLKDAKRKLYLEAEQKVFLMQWFMGLLGFIFHLVSSPRGGLQEQNKEAREMTHK